MRNIIIAIVFTAISVHGAQKTNLSKLDYINPMIGTDSLGHTTPAATTPFGMIQLGPSMEMDPWNWKRCSGYHYSELFIKGFAHNHISGAGLAALGDILMMPMTGNLKITPGTFDNLDQGYMSRFTHDEENASAGYYEVRLADYDINVELTATPHVGFHRYTVNNADSMHLIIDPIHGVGEHGFKGSIEILSDTEIQGWKQSSGMGGERKPHFYAKFSKPFSSYGMVTGGVRYAGRKNVESESAKAYVTFNVKKGEVVEVVVSLSQVDFEGARANYNAEAKGKTFNQVHAEARDLWQKKCDKFEIKGTDSEKRIFYTAVYHSFLSPNIISDVNGNYCINLKKYHSIIPQFSNFSTWDTYRAQNPLLTIVEHAKLKDFVNSLASRRTEIGGYLPVWECMGNDNVCMLGRSPVAIMAEAIVKDVPGIDIESSYISMYESLMTAKNSDWWYNSEKSGMEEYIANSFVPANIATSVSKTTEFNYYDYALSEVAKKLGKLKDAEYFYHRSLGYRQLWNAEKRYLWPRYLNGDWKSFDMTKWADLTKYYVSGNIWGYSSYTPHDMTYMIQLMGGKDKYVKWLDAIFNDNTPLIGEQHMDISGFIGKYGHGDEPSHQMPYLYVLADSPEKTQTMVHRICREMYNDTPHGLVNNDDMGQMSSWYIFSALGFYPVNPVSCNYILGAPLYKNACINLENGKKLSINTKNWRPDCFLVKQITLNGHEIKDGIISHSEMMKGGELLFVMK